MSEESRQYEDVDLATWEVDSDEYWEPDAPEPEPKATTWPSRVVAFGHWASSVARGLLDIRFTRVATRDLLPAVYALGLVLAVAIPIALTVLVFQWSIFAGVLFLLVVAPVMGVTIAATIRLCLELVLSLIELAGMVDDISTMGAELQNSLGDLSGPVHQMASSVRAVQFWRFKERRQSAKVREMRR
ncbi:DUF4282 domain-containing protein [Antrihabitans spumae]|uniref:DUF4282 domain-containing protein n=1 Tax=Antrihabitans spumae TaxID=3373370 RepID=A0ABW7KI04_9NOCA